MIVVDSSVWINYFRGIENPQTIYLENLFATNDLAVGDLILMEVLQGFDSEKQFVEALELFQSVHLIRLGGYVVSVEAARNYRKLRAKGFTIRKSIDSMIATACILNGYQLLHNNRDFFPFQEYLGLKSVI